MADEENRSTGGEGRPAPATAGRSLAPTLAELGMFDPGALGSVHSSFGKPYAFILAPRLRELSDLADLPSQLQLTQARLHSALAACLPDHGVVYRPDPAVQGLTVTLSIPGSPQEPDGPMDRIYRFQIALFLEKQDNCPARIRPRLFGETVRRQSPGLIFAGPDDDPYLALLFMKLLSVLEQIAGASDDRKRSGAFLSEIGKPFCCTRLYTIRYMKEPLDDLLRQLQQAVADTEAALEDALHERRPLVRPHAQSQSVDMIYSVPSPAGGSRLFRFQIEFQLGYVQQGSSRMYTITPRLFAEVVRQDNQGLMRMGEGDDSYYTALVQEIQAIFRRMAPL